MVAQIAQQELRGRGSSPRRNHMEACPMAMMCTAMMNKPRSGLSVMLAGGVLIVLGVLIILEPRILVWLVGAAFGLFGIALLMLSGFLRRQSAQMRNM